ncbi:MAG: hypothetical protein E7590_02180 [Ruminococcaceae bacterium]|nr:hypothetical protein [Oscillospiraceae bacterium]
MKQLKFLKWQGKKAVVLLALTIVLALGVVGSTMALIITKTNSVTNTFQPASISSATAQSVVGNMGDAPSFARIAVVVNWVATDGTVYAVAPVVGTDYSITYDTANWKQGADGFWYYTKALQNLPDDVDINADDFDETPYVTTSLITNCTQLVAAPDGYSLKVEIIASTIQAEPETVVEEQWGVTVENGALTPN